MAGVWKRDGTVAVTNGNKKVTGTGTTFADTKNGVAKGHLFCITSGTSVDFYEVDYVVSNTELYLVQAYRGTTATGKAYEIITTFSDSVPEFARRLTATLSAYQQQSDAFQALLTSTATTVEVTAPDGTKQTLIPWKRVTSEGEGQAARAKTEADKAAASAALAGDIVAASALPLPDVWAPLTDSLRLFTGYGREVKVGEDVVARMVNFSRSTTATYIGKDGQLKTAAANEPRFEKEGLLLEGQSTNLLIWSDDMSKLIQVNTSVSEGVITGAGAAGVQTRIEYGGVIPVGVSGYTITVEYDPSQSMGICQLRVGGDESGWVEGSTPVTLEDSSRKMVRTITPDGWVRVSVTSKVASSSSAIRINFAAKGAASAAVSTVGLTAKVRRVQVEALPFASSYIPTNGAAVTRAADVCWIPNALNVTPDYGDITIAMEVRRNLAIPSSVFPRAIHISDRQFVVADSARIMARGGGLEQVNISTAAPGTRERIAATIKGSTIACFLNGTKATLPQTPILPVSNGTSCFIGSRNGLDGLFGHVRNVRIWQRTLSDEQIKAAA
ncbi:LamG-like jellyroll fold domain-containing protein [Aeromonas caviae]|uniref:phage head spike fiber domain-containing protein n=1 Tax=Aeromonas caviae TaxID=648 RepID=UPI0038CF96F4